VILNARCRLLTIRSCHPWVCFRVRASLRLWWPASAITVWILGNNALKPPSSRAPARRSDVSAGSTRLATSRPSVSTKMWRLRPFTRLCASKPRAPPRSVVLESTKKSGVRCLQPSARTARRIPRKINRLKGNGRRFTSPIRFDPRLFGALPGYLVNRALMYFRRHPCFVHNVHAPAKR
jgi:hypothetical protein